MAEGLTLRAFARLAGCDEKVVRRKVLTGHIFRRSDGKIDPAYLSVDWRRGERPSVRNENNSADNADSQPPPPLDYFEGRKLWTIVESDRVKENYAARLKKLQFDQMSARIVEIDEVIEHIRAEYKTVRDEFIGFGASVAEQIVVSRSPEEIQIIIDDEVSRRLTVLTTLQPA